jgi:AbrB family looped-hinge helix DNA binding protein
VPPAHHGSAAVSLHLPVTDRVASGYSTANINCPLFEASSSFTLTFMTEVKKRRRGATTISSKNQITIPAEALRKAGLEAGERVVAHADGAGRVILEREHDVIAEFAGALTGTYNTGELDDLRSEWD